MFTAYKAILITNNNLSAIRTELGEDDFHKISEDFGHFITRRMPTYVVFGVKEDFLETSETVAYVPAGVIDQKCEIAQQAPTQFVWITMKK